MRLIAATLGSAGDLFPVLAVARALAARGHQVTLATSPAHAPEVQAAGLGFAPIGAAEDLPRTEQHPALWHPMRGLGVLWRGLYAPAIADTLALLRQAQGEGIDGVIAAPMVVGARLAHEAWGLPLLGLLTAPTALRSTRQPPRLFAAQPGWLPHWAAGLMWRLLDRQRLQPMAAPALTRARAALGLPALGEPVFDRWLHAPAGALGLWPGAWASDPGDWPVLVRATGFAFHEPLCRPDLARDLTRDSAPDAALHRFLSDGPPPVVFTPGTAQRQAGAFAQAALAAAQAQGLRALVLARHAPASLLGPQGPQSLVHPWAALPQVLAHAAGLVHHGGIGTAAQGLRAGVPQLVCPQAHDQHDNALRLRRLGVAGAPVHGAPGQAGFERALRHGLAQLANPRLAAMARQRQAEGLGHDGAKQAAAHIEQALNTRRGLAPRRH